MKRPTFHETYRAEDAVPPEGLTIADKYRFLRHVHCQVAGTLRRTSPLLPGTAAGHSGLTQTLDPLSGLVNLALASIGLTWTIQQVPGEESFREWDDR